jgi:hypothetical protein
MNEHELTELAEAIFEDNVNSMDVHFIFHEKKTLYYEILDAIVEALKKKTETL